MVVEGGGEGGGLVLGGQGAAVVAVDVVGGLLEVGVFHLDGLVQVLDLAGAHRAVVGLVAGGGREGGCGGGGGGRLILFGLILLGLVYLGLVLWLVLLGLGLLCWEVPTLISNNELGTQTRSELLEPTSS